MKEKTGIKKNFFMICLLAFAGTIIYGLPYFRSYYYDTYQNLYHLTNTQMGLLGSAYGMLGVFSYMFGGVLADRFKAKKLLILSMIATGLGGFLHLFVTDFRALMAIYALWGFTSLLTFWPALMKIVRTQGNEDEQSRAYGIFEGGRGVFNAPQLAIATAIFGFFQAKMMPELGIKWIVIFYSAAPILCGIIFIFVLKEPGETKVKEKASEPEKEEPKEKFSWSNIGLVLKMPAVWLTILMMFCSYTFNMSIYYFTPYASNVLKTTAVVAAVLTVLQQYCRPFASPIGGFLADKIGRGQVMAGGFLLMGVGTLVLILSSGAGGAQMVFVVAACIIVYVGMYSNFGIYFSLLTEGGVPLKVSGLAIGIASTLGYLPEVIAPIVAGNILDTFAGAKGYHIYFGIMIAMAVIGFIASIVWANTYGKRYKEQMKKQKNK